MEIKNLSIDIIIPVYNCRNFIDRCLKSILDQKCQEKLRIILVDDGSTDGSSKIVDDYANNFQNIIAIHKKNGGISSARNSGLKLVNSEYFTFVDSDDWLEKDYIKKVILQLTTNSVDVLMLPYLREYKNKSINNFYLGNQDRYFNKGDTRTVLLKRLFGLTNKQLNHPLRIDNISPVWGKFYKTNKFSEITFKDRKEVFSEDLYFNVECILKAESSKYHVGTKYVYFKDNDSSTVHTYDSNMLGGYKNLYKKMHEIIAKTNLNKQYIQVLNNRIIINELSILRNISMSKMSFLNKNELFKKVMNDEIYKKAYKDFPIGNLPFIYRLFYFNCKYKMSMCNLLLLQIGEKLKKQLKQ